jgi:hypothetical protein
MYGTVTRGGEVKMSELRRRSALEEKMIQQNATQKIIQTIYSEGNIIVNENNRWKLKTLSFISCKGRPSGG